MHYCHSVRCSISYISYLFPIAQVNDRYNVGDYAGAMDSSQKARHWSKIAIIVGTVLTLVSVGLVVASIVLPLIVAAGAVATSN